ncbi:MAG: hypothetical protein ACI8WB_005881 [Phenylobacterium sp.]|jgi:hypothetical protein
MLNLILNLIKKNPLILTFAFVLTTIILGLFPWLTSHTYNYCSFTILLILIISVFFTASYSLGYHIINFKGKSINELIFLYLEVIILFGCVYFLLSYIGNSEKHFHGLSNISTEILAKNPMLVFTSLTEYIHFSLVTVTTVGFGNVYPKSAVALIITACQILFGLYTVVIGITTALSIAVNKKVAEESEAKKTPLVLAAYEDISVLVNRIMILFFEFHKYSTPSEAPSNIEEFFSQEHMELVYSSLDLNAKAPVMPEQNWWLHIPQEAKSILEYSEKIIIRHAGHVEPKIYNLVHHIAESFELLSMKSIPQTRSLPNRDACLPVLTVNAISPKNEFLANLLGLYEWCSNLEKQHSEFNTKMRGMFNYEKHCDEIREVPPTSMYKPLYGQTNQDVLEQLEQERFGVE